MMACSEVHAEVNTAELRRLSHTESFIASEYIVTRRDTEISVTLHGENDGLLLLDSAKLVHESGNEIEVEVYDRRSDAKDTHLKLNTPANTAVGVYKLVISGHFEDGKEFEATVPTKMVVLFNSWSRKDNAYLETETERQQYVLNKLSAGIPWEFDLNEPSCLRATMHMIERISKLSFDEKRNHPSVAAEISSLVERGDDFGVLETYRGGNFVSPSVLGVNAGYYRLGKESVHNWMFHGVVLSVWRVLGIPSRHVTEVLPMPSPMLPNPDQPTLQLTRKEKENKRFKAWNEIWSHNVDTASEPKGWQVVDMTVTVLMATHGGWDAESKLVGFEGVPWLQGGSVMLDCTELHAKFQQMNLQSSMVILIHTVDYNLLQNRTAHRTNFYEDDSLIVRRGQSFTIVLKSHSDMKLENAGVLACFKLESEHTSVDEYSFEVNALAVIQGGTATVNLQTPATAAIGKYSIGLSLPNSMAELSVQDVDVTLLFNPWCSDDSCFYSGSLLDLSEYVLNKSGSVWMGATTDHYGHFRQLSQFDKNSLEAAFLVLTKMSLNDRADPVKVSKHITNQISMDVDDSAMPMVNRWSGNYSEGINLMAWTLFRAVGLASRLVTNFDPGREASSYNRATEMSWIEDGSELFTGNQFLNFHTWNEVYMAGSDASPGLIGGWQTLDAVPRQWRPNVPAAMPFKPIKVAGDIPPVMHLVNDNYLTVHKDKSLFLTSMNLDMQGCNKQEKENVKVLSPMLPPVIYTSKECADELLSDETIGKSDISLLLQVQKGIMSGNNFGVKITFANRASYARRIQYYIHATTFQSHVGLLDGVCDMDAGQTYNGYVAVTVKCVELEIHVGDYLSALSECKSILFTAMISVPTENISIFRTFTLKAPMVDIAVPSASIHMGEVSTISVNLTNPLKVPLNDGWFFLHGNGFIEDDILPIGLVSANQSVQATMMIKPMKEGTCNIILRFSSKDLPDALGQTALEVLPAKNTDDDAN